VLTCRLGRVEQAMRAAAGIAQRLAHGMRAEQPVAGPARLPLRQRRGRIRLGAAIGGRGIGGVWPMDAVSGVLFAGELLAFGHVDVYVYH
jgi:hypothetical protein